MWWLLFRYLTLLLENKAARARSRPFWKGEHSPLWKSGRGFVILPSMLEDALQATLATSLPPLVVATTPRLWVRQFQAGDTAALQRLFGDAEVMRFGDGAQDADWVANWLAHRVAEYAHNAERAVWAVVARETAEVLGYCGLFAMDDVNGRPETEIGYRLARPFWGHGYATEAATAVRDYAHHTLHLPRLIALIDPANSASIRVAEKLGMVREAEAMMPGYTHPDWVYALDLPVGGKK